MAYPDRPGGEGQDPCPGERQPDGGAKQRRLDEKLDAWASQSPRRANIAAIFLTAALMVWLIAATRELPDRESILATLALLLLASHAIAHTFIVCGLKRLNARGSPAADRALRAYLRRVTQRDLAIAWGLFALIAWLSEP